MTAGPVWLRMHLGADYLSVYPFIHLYVDLTTLSTPLIHLPACPPNITRETSIVVWLTAHAPPRRSPSSKLRCFLKWMVVSGRRPAEPQCHHTTHNHNMQHTTASPNLQQHKRSSLSSAQLSSAQLSSAQLSSAQLSSAQPSRFP
jgi:hypothetical protein